MSSTFHELNSNSYIKRGPRGSHAVGTYGRILNSGPYLTAQTWCEQTCHTVKCQDSNSEKQKLFSSQGLRAHSLIPTSSLQPDCPCCLDSCPSLGPDPCAILHQGLASVFSGWGQVYLPLSSYCNVMCGFVLP